MSSSYSGNPTGITGRPAATISNPVGADPRNAASVVTPLSKLADYIKALFDRAGLLDTIGTWTALQTFNAALKITSAGYGTPTIEDATAIGTDARRLIWLGNNASIGATPKVRIYREGAGFEFTYNAEWSTVNHWQLDDAGLDSLYFGFSLANGLWVRRKTVASHGGAAFSNWDDSPPVINPTTPVTSGYNTGWANVASPYVPYSWRDSHGMVRVAGKVQRSSGTNSLIHGSFFPAGSRHSVSRSWPVSVNDGTGWRGGTCSVSNAGDLYLEQSNPNWPSAVTVDLNGTFLPDA